MITVIIIIILFTKYSELRNYIKDKFRFNSVGFQLKTFRTVFYICKIYELGTEILDNGKGQDRMRRIRRKIKLHEKDERNMSMRNDDDKEEKE